MKLFFSCFKKAELLDKIAVYFEIDTLHITYAKKCVININKYINNDK